MSESSRGGVALVTGANRGIGKEVARQLAELTYEVLLGGRDEAKATAAAQELSESTGGAVRAVTLDVADPASIEAVAEQVADEQGRLDVLVNNAGIAESSPLSRTTLASWARHFDVNVTGPFLCTRAVVPRGKTAIKSPTSSRPVSTRPATMRRSSNL